MSTFEYSTQFKSFAEPLGPVTQERIDWYNTYGSQGWEIYESQSEFDPDHTVVNVRIWMRRQTSAVGGSGTVSFTGTATATPEEKK